MHTNFVGLKFLLVDKDRLVSPAVSERQRATNVTAVWVTPPPKAAL